MPTGIDTFPNLPRRKVDLPGRFQTHFGIHRSTPTKPQAMPSGTSNCLISLLFSIPSLKPSKNGTFALALQKARLCTKAAATATTLRTGKAYSQAGGEDGPKRVRPNSATELSRLRMIYIPQCPMLAWYYIPKS